MGVDAVSVRAVDDARLAPGIVRPLHEGYTFAALPATIQRLLTGAGADPGLPAPALAGLPERAEQVVLVLLDAFGWCFFERHAEHHPLLRRLIDHGAVAKLTSQFPSTTTAHITTLHSGVGVAEHGLYEWNGYEPSIDELITPLLFSFAGDGARDTLRCSGADPRVLYPTRTVYRRLTEQGVACSAFQPAAFSPSTYDGVMLDGAQVRPYATLREGLADAARVLHARPGPAYAYVYVDTVDAAGHERGPKSAFFDAIVRHCLDAIEGALLSFPPGTLVLLGADHGQVDVDPARTIFVNERWPQIERHLRRGASGRPLAPAGSPRDLFLHVVPGSVEEVVTRLEEVVGDLASVHPVRDLLAQGLFGADPGPRLRARVGDVCVLPARGETVWWRERGRFDMRFLGHHGGLSPEEAETVVAGLVT